MTFFEHEKRCSGAIVRFSENSSFPQGAEVVNFLSCSTQLSMKFHPHIETKMLKYKDFYCFINLRCCIYSTNKCKHIGILTFKSRIYIACSVELNIIDVL